LHLSELHDADTMSVDPDALLAERESMKEQIAGEFTLRDEAAGLVQTALKAVHMAGQNHGARLASDPLAAMFGLAGPGENDALDLEQINQRLAFIGVSLDSLDELTPWTVAYLIVDIVTVTFGELTGDLPQL
jgi:hypothetical protein